MKKLKAEDITPQCLESNDERFSIKVDDDGWLELTMTDLAGDHVGHYVDGVDSVQHLSFPVEDLERLIKILVSARQINTRAWRTIKNG